MKQFSAMRWWLVGALFLASVLNYLDRQTLSILAPTIQKDLQISDKEYGGIVSLFLAAYTLAYIFSGRLTDKFGTRLSLALFVGWWSLANILTGWARSLVSLGTCRFLLGLGEAGNYTVGPKVVSEWFPAKERGVAIGLYTLGAAIGATIAPIIVVHLATQYSWRAAFMTTGALGLLWLVPWLLLYPRNKPTAVAVVPSEARAFARAGKELIPASPSSSSSCRSSCGLVSTMGVAAARTLSLLSFKYTKSGFGQ